MKFSNLILSGIIISALAFSGCEKEIVSRNMEFEALNPAKTDTASWRWKTILLTKADEFPVTSPIAITAPDYKLELLEIKSWQNKMTGQEKDIVKYWSAGVVLRWNEIMRELVAKYNLPPYQNEDNSYPIPNAANPLAYPYFPFSQHC